MGTWVDLPVFRDENGVWQRAITLPDEICGPIGKAVLDELVARGLAAKGPAFQPDDQSDKGFLSPRAREGQCLPAWVRRAAHWQGRAASAV
jgi:hypothetical protein